MRRSNALIALTALAVGSLIGSQFGPAPSVADEVGTPGPYVVVGFDSLLLAQLPMSPAESDTRIELRQSDRSSAPASITLTRYSYEPGGRIALPYVYPGPVAYYVESGTLTLEAIGPQVRIVDVQRGTPAGHCDAHLVRGPALLHTGGRYDVPAGNFVYSMDGDLGPTRNDGTTALVVLAVFLQPETDGESFETFGTPAS